MDVALPVWTIRPNWKNGILERLEWMTDVLTSDTGVEQRRSVRVSPRRSFESTVNPTRAERTFLDLALHRLGSEQWLVPLWHDQAVLDPGVVLGGQRLTIDNTYREFVTGGYAILYGSTFGWEVVQIASQDDTGLNLTAPTTHTWLRGTKVYPLRTMTLADTSVSALTSRVGQSQLLWTINEANDYPEIMPADTVYQGAPIITIAPDRQREIKLDQVRLSFEQDGEVGLRYRKDTAGRAFAVQSHNWMVQGRQNQAAFRSMLYWLRGRQRMVWLPSFNDDIFISRAAAIGNTNVAIQKAGFGYVGSGGPIPGRARFWTGKEVVLQSAVQAAPSAQEERLGLTAPLTAAYAPGASWGFLEPARLDTDTIELQHHTDSEGVFECSATWRTFQNARDPSGVTAVFPPQGVASLARCGEPPSLDKNPCSGGVSQIVNLDAKVGSVTVSGFSTDTTIRISMPAGGQFSGWSKYQAGNDWSNFVGIVPDIGPQVEFGLIDAFATPEAARAAWVPVELGGATSYKFFILDNIYDDNRGGLTLLLEVL